MATVVRGSLAVELGGIGPLLLGRRGVHKTKGSPDAMKEAFRTHAGQAASARRAELRRPRSLSATVWTHLLLCGSRHASYLFEPASPSRRTASIEDDVGRVRLMRLSDVGAII